MTSNKMAEYLYHTATEIQRHPEWRVGQAYFNILHRLHPEVADAVRGTSKDPFYNDTRIPAFLDEVAAYLEEE